jgi:hypothetical protein
MVLYSVNVVRRALENVGFASAPSGDAGFCLMVLARRWHAPVSVPVERADLYDGEMIRDIEAWLNDTVVLKDRSLVEECTRAQEQVGEGPVGSECHIDLP